MIPHIVLFYVRSYVHTYPPPKQLGYFFPEWFLDKCFLILCFFDFLRMVSDPLFFQIVVTIHALKMQLGYFFPEWYLH